MNYKIIDLHRIRFGLGCRVYEATVHQPLVSLDTFHALNQLTGIPYNYISTLTTWKAYQTRRQCIYAGGVDYCN